MIAVFRGLQAGHSPDRGGARGSQYDGPFRRNKETRARVRSRRESAACVGSTSPVAEVTAIVATVRLPRFVECFLPVTWI